MFPGPAVSKKASSSSQPLSRLAEMAEVVSRQQQIPFSITRSTTGDHAIIVAQQSTFHRDQSASVSAVLRKRTAPTDFYPTAKSPKTTVVAQPAPRDADDESEDDNSEDMKDVRFREYQAEIWSEKFEDLCEFRRKYGHCHVPHTFTDNAPLAQWVKRQRYQYKLKVEGKRSTLSDERVRLLNQIGFIWNSHDVVWEERWYELMDFQRVHGHCIVPSNYDKNPQLAIWVKRQRRQYKFWQENKSTSMTLERIEKLNNLGFSWDCRKSNIGAKTMTNNVCCVVAANSSAMIAAPALVFPVEAVRATVRKGTTEQPIQFKTPDRLRPGGGFPLPKPPGADSVTGSKEPQFRDITRAVLLSAPVDPSTSSTGESPSKASTSRSLENLPCEFFSFSRKFTKFPKIDLSK